MDRQTGMRILITHPFPLDDCPAGDPVRTLAAALRAAAHDVHLLLVAGSDSAADESLVVQRVFASRSVAVQSGEAVDVGKTLQQAGIKVAREEVAKTNERIGLTESTGAGLEPRGNASVFHRSRCSRPPRQITD